MESITSYFNGEKRQYRVGVGISIAFIAISAFFLLQQSPLLKGIAYVVIPLSIILLSVCFGLILRTPKDIARVTAFQKEAPTKIQTEELPRMEKVVKSFDLLKKAERVLFVIGSMLSIIFWESELIRGVGMGLAIMSPILYIFDYIAALRGEKYIQLLKSL